MIRSQILCDVCGLVGETQNHDNKFHLMRYELRKRGWTTGPGGRDWCPAHPRGKERSLPEILEQSLRPTPSCTECRNLIVTDHKGMVPYEDSTSMQCRFRALRCTEAMYLAAAGHRCRAYETGVPKAEKQ